METRVLLSWAIFIACFVLPVVHVTFSRRSGPWTPPPGSRCPLGPRAGWLVLVLFLGPVGWLMFWRGAGRGRAPE